MRSENSGSLKSDHCTHTKWKFWNSFFEFKPKMGPNTILPRERQKEPKKKLFLLDFLSSLKIESFFVPSLSPEYVSLIKHLMMQYWFRSFVNCHHILSSLISHLSFNGFFVIFFLFLMNTQSWMNSRWVFNGKNF